MRLRRLAVAGLVVFALAAVLAALGAGGSSDPTGGKYLVRAEFDNASFIVKGENVKVSGVTVGKVHGLDVTPDHTAVLILEIDDAAFRPFRRDAHCSIGLQSLIGEQFVECEPTQKRGDSVAPAKVLPRIRSGRGKGEYLLPASQTIKPVDLDLVGNIMRLPYRQRLCDLADQATPTIQALAAQAPAVNEATARLGPLATEATPAVKTLGAVADRGRKTFPKIDAVVSQLDALGTPLVPLAKNLASLSSSFDDTGGIESLMRFIYFYTGVINGEDASGHYTRAGVGPNGCIDRATTYDAGCGAKYNKNSVIGTAAAAKAAKASTAKETSAVSASSATPAATKAVASGSGAQLLDYLLGP